MNDAKITDPLQHGDKLVFSESPGVSIKPRWLDFVKTPFAKQEIQKHFRGLIAKERRGKQAQMSLEDRPTTLIFKERGLEKLQQLFRQLSLEREGTEHDLIIDYLHGKRWYQQVEVKYQTVGNRLERQFSNFFIQVGLKEIEVDGDRGSLLWKLTEDLYQFQRSLQTVEISIINSEMALREVLKKIQVNIETMQTVSDSTSLGHIVVRIGVTPSDFRWFQKHGQDALEQLTMDGVVLWAR